MSETSHFLQAAALWKRWRARRRRTLPPRADVQVPEAVSLPPEVWRHYRHFSWVVWEQRLVLMILGFLLTACAVVWSLAWHLRTKPAIVVRAAPSLKEAAAAFHGVPDISYDQMAFFLNGCLPLLYAIDNGGHPLLPLVQGLVAPDIYDEAERRLDGAGRDVRANRMTQTLTITEMSDVVADPKSGRAAARLDGCVTVTVHGAEARFFPWRARVLLEVNPVSRLNPYPFFLVRLEQKTGDEALSWEQQPGGGLPEP